jgi:ankyrin repeat protein
VLQLLIERDELGRTPLDVSCFLGFKNIALYLLSKMGTPQDVIHQEINVDNEGRNLYHNLCYKGQYDCMIVLLNIERVYLKKTLFDQLLREKNKYRLKNMDIEHGHLSKAIFHDADSVQRHEEFNIRVFNLLEQYSKDIIDRYRQILCQQDKFRRNCIHYGAMSKFTKSCKTIEAILSIELDNVPATKEFNSLFFELQELESKEDAKFDPRKYKDVLGEFKHLLSHNDYARIAKEFRHQVKLLLKEVLNCQDVNYHTPLHIASYFGDFKQSRLFTHYGANPSSAATAEAPLEVGKDKFTRDVL